MIKIKSIKFYNHEFFGNQSFDFTIDGETPANSIIFAGENGSGKTKMLEELYNICNKTFYHSSMNYSHKYCEMVVDLSSENYCSFENENLKIDEVILTVFTGSPNGLNNQFTFFSGGNKIDNIKKIGTTNSLSSFRINGLYSNVDINYKPRSNIQGITTKTLDNDENKIPSDMALEVIQLLVDIAIEDSCELDDWVSSHKNEVPPEEVFHPRLKRFTNAFEKMFGDTIKYKEIRKNSIPIFEKNNQEIEISSLSSGEKQVIFRGVYLLRNKNSLKGVPAFIDEPELSMHPKWEEKIFEYYKNVFSDEKGQTSQMFIATHSEHILSNALNNDDALVIKIQNGFNQRFFKDGPGIVLPTITLAEIKYSIFDLYTADFHTLLYGYIQQHLVFSDDGKVIESPTILQTDKWLCKQNVSMKEYKINGKYTRHYDTLSTYIRNCIDHPDSEHEYTVGELSESINEMIRIIKIYDFD